MTIVHVVEPFASGIATFIRLLVENLKDDDHIVIHGERPQVMNAEEVQLDFPKRNVRFIRWKSAQRSIRPDKDLMALFELYRLLQTLNKQQPIDAVHLHSSKSGFLGRLACKMAKIGQVIYTPNGAPFLKGPRLLNWLFGQLEKVGSYFGGKVVCCSTSEWVAYHELGIEAVNINNGIDLECSAGSLFQPIYRTEKRKSVFRVVTCGRITDQKNPALFNSIAKYFEGMEGYEFIWIGDGEARKLLTSANTTVTGWMPIMPTQQMLKTADLYLSTSHFEGLPFAVLEALLLEKPVLLRNCIGHKDIVIEGVNGNLFTEEQEAITKILLYANNRAMLPIMGKYSRAHCLQQFDSNTTFTRYRKLYESTQTGH